jgi:hypothetical protein
VPADDATPKAHLLITGIITTLRFLFAFFLVQLSEKGFFVNHWLVESAPFRYDAVQGLSRRSFLRPQNQNYEDYNCQDPGHNPNPSNVVHRVSPFSDSRSRCRKRNSPESSGPDVLFHKLNPILEKTLLGIDLRYDPC